jgi:DNA processing protein
VLFAQGDAEILLYSQLAIVGSRNPTPAGRETAYYFSSALVQAGLTVTSGLAIGIDGMAHRGALQAGGPTLAVLGSGLKHIYPRAHQNLAEEIRVSGLLLSEFPPSAPPLAKNFPRRNRIISGLAWGALIIEAAIRSGSLITARFAMEGGKEVFAVPGSIYNPLTQGCHKLIQEGAKLVEKVEDILEELDTKTWIRKANPCSALPSVNVPSLAKGLLKWIDTDLSTFDLILARSGLTAGEVSSMLLLLELDGCIKRVAGGYLRTPTFKHNLDNR